MNGSMISPTRDVERLQHAVNEHDLDAVVACFRSDYRNETPAHPGRGFVGRDQVRANWQRIFDGMPDVGAMVLRTVVDGATVWSEWEFRGHRPTGELQILRGVIIFGIAGEQFAWARFYVEPVDAGEGGVDAAIDKIVEADAR